MAVTIHLPQVHQPSVKRLAVAGAVVLATAVAFTGIQAVVNNTDTTNSTSGGSSNVSTVDVADTSDLAVWAHSNGLTGLSPASLGATTAVVPDSAVTTGGNNPAAAAAGVIVADATATTSAATLTPDAVARAAEISLAPNSTSEFSQFETGAVSPDAVFRLSALGVIADTSTVATAQSGGFATQSEFIEANVGSYAAPAAAADTAAVATAQSGGFATQSEFIEANVGSYAVQSGAVSSAPSSYDPYPVDTSSTGVTIEPRSNFASDIDWLEANGWTTD